MLHVDKTQSILCSINGDYVIDIFDSMSNIFYILSHLASTFKSVANSDQLQLYLFICLLIYLKYLYFQC